jgi:RHS repeat-associated protein
LFPASRLQTVSNGTSSATYSFVDNADLVDHITFANNGQPVMTTSNQFDNLNRLLRTESWAGTNLVARSAFGYNTANQRKAMTNADNTYWLYDYDFLGQVTSARKYWPDGTLMAGQQNEYTFDDIGNRKTAISGGDASGANQRTQYYTNNLLNQYTGRTVPGYMEVQGSANTNATVTVNLQPVYRFGDYFRKEYAVNNATGAVWLSLTNFAVYSPGGTNIDICDTNTGWAYVNQTPQLFGHDADGNLTNNGRFTFYWDGENRLTNITSLPTANFGSQVQLQFVNDYRARRIQKIVFTNNGSIYVAQYTNKFTYDENNLLVILNPDLTPQLTFVWGLDASGSMHGAGGVGGLISMTVHSGPYVGTYFYVYGGNYNVVALVSAADGRVMAQYDYDVFGNVLRAIGPLAKINPFLFSTKFYDWETGLYYYGYRYYDPGSGRWLSRDPLEEKGGNNLYNFVNNNSTIYIDPRGLIWVLLDSEAWTQLFKNIFIGDISNEGWDPKGNMALRMETGTGITPLTDANGNTIQPGDLILQTVLDSGFQIVLMGVGGTEEKAMYEAVTETLEAARLAKASKTLKCAADTGTQFTKSSLELGQKLHRAYKDGLADGIKTFKEFRLPSGRRIDFLDVENGIIYELKPNNPRQIREGIKQLQEYLKEIQSMPQFQGIDWIVILDTY